MSATPQVGGRVQPSLRGPFSRRSTGGAVWVEFHLGNAFGGFGAGAELGRPAQKGDVPFGDSSKALMP